MLKKLTFAFLGLALVISSFGSVIAPVAATTIADGSVIKVAGNSALYLVSGTTVRVFPHEAVYKTWGYDTTNWTGITTVTQDELDSYTTGLPVPFRAGVTFTSNGSGAALAGFTQNAVFVSGEDGAIHPIESAAVYASLYPSDWSTLTKIPTSFLTNFTNFKVGDVITSSNANFVDGSLLSMGGNVYVVDGGVAKKITVATATTAKLYANGEWIMPLVPVTAGSITVGSDAVASDVTTTVPTWTPSVVATGGALTVGIASTTPAAANIPAGIPSVLAKFNFAAGENDVTISTLKVTALGFGNASYIDGITLYDNGIKVGNSKDMSGTDRFVIFNFSNPIVVTAGTSKEIVAKATINFPDGGSTSGYFGLGISAATDVTSNASSTTGSFPANGNQMYSADGMTTVGKITFDADDNDDTAKVGEDGVTAVEFTATADNVEDINLSGLTLKNNGNLKSGTYYLYHEDTLIDDAVMNADKYVSFAFDNVLIKKGETEDFKVKVDFENGDTGDTVQLYVKDDSDVVATGASYGYQTQVEKTEWTTANNKSTTITLTAGDLVINFDGTAYPAANIMKDTDNIVMGKLTMTAGGEAVKITAMTFTVSGTGFGGTDIENPELVDLATSGVIDLSQDGGTCTTEDEIEIPAGTTKSFNFRLDTTATAGNNEVYNVTLAAAGITAEGVTTGTTVDDITPSSISSKNMTVVYAALTQSVATISAVDTIAGSTDMSVYKGTLKTSSSSSIKITKIVFKATADSVFNEDDVTAAKLYINDSLVSTKTIDTATLTFDGLSYIIPAGKTYTMYVKLSFAGTITDPGATPFKVHVDSMTTKDSDSKTVYVNGGAIDDDKTDTAEGPLVTVSSTGYFGVNLVTDQTDANRDVYVVAGTTSGFIGALKMDAQQEAVKVKDLVLYALDNAVLGDDVERVELVGPDKTTVLATSTDFEAADVDDDSEGNDDTIVTFDNWDYVVAEPGLTYVYIRVVTKGIGSGTEQTGTSGTDIQLGINSITAEGNQSGDSISMTAKNGVVTTGHNEFSRNYSVATYSTKKAGNVGVKVNAITNTLSNGQLNNGDSIIGKYKFNVASDANLIPTGEASKFDLGNTTITLKFADGVTIGDSGEGSELTEDLRIYWASDEDTYVSVTDLSPSATSYELPLSRLGDITGEDTLIIEALNIDGATANGDYIQTKLENLNTTGINWTDNTGSDTNIDGLRLSSASVAGGTLSF